MTLKNLDLQILQAGSSFGVARFVESTSLKRLWYFDGRFLDAAAFRSEQDYFRNVVRLSNRATGHGVVSGLDVNRTDSGFTVTSGLALNADGQMIRLPDDTDLDLDELLSPRPTGGNSPQEDADAASFQPCPAKVDSGDNSDTLQSSSRFLVLSVAPIEALCGDEEAFGSPCSSACAAESDRSYVIEGVDFRVRDYHPNRPISHRHPNQIRGTVASAWFASERDSRRSEMTGQLLRRRFWCEGTPAPSGKEVDIAIFERHDDTIRWIDQWTVRRELCDPSTKHHWLNATNMRPWSVFVAQVLQFQCQLAHCLQLTNAVPDRADYDRLKTQILDFKGVLKQATVDTSLQVAFQSIASGFDVISAQAAVASTRHAGLVNCVGDELPPCGWLPVIANRGACVSTKLLMGNDVRLAYYQVRPDHIGQAFHEAQHLDRISLIQRGSEPKDDVDILVPTDLSGNELDWVFFTRRQHRISYPCGDLSDSTGRRPDYAAEFLNAATESELREAGLNPLQAKNLVAHRKTSEPFQSIDQVQQVSQIGKAAQERLKEYVAQQPYGLHLLDRLCQEEYGIQLVELVDDSTDLGAQRRRRLAGVVMKHKFAESETMTKGQTPTEALRRWSWDENKLNEVIDPDQSDGGEAWFVDQLRLMMPQVGRQATWADLQIEADTERGLFKVAALWLNDKARGQATKEWSEYYHAPESRVFKTSLNVANTLAELGIVGLLSSILPAGPLLGAVGLVLLKDGTDVIFANDPDYDLPNEPDQQS